jgi:hypothetical protein
MGKLKRVLLGIRSLRQAEWYLNLAEDKSASLDQRRDALERAVKLQVELRDIARNDNKYLKERNQARRILERLQQLGPARHPHVDSYL